MNLRLVGGIVALTLCVSLGWCYTVVLVVYDWSCFEFRFWVGLTGCFGWLNVWMLLLSDFVCVVCLLLISWICGFEMVVWCLVGFVLCFAAFDFSRVVWFRLVACGDVFELNYAFMLWLLWVCFYLCFVYIWLETSLPAVCFIWFWFANYMLFRVVSFCIWCDLVGIRLRFVNLGVLAIFYDFSVLQLGCVVMVC